MLSNVKVAVFCNYLVSYRLNNVVNLQLSYEGNDFCMEDLRKYIGSLNESFVEIAGGSYCYISTGEIFTNSEVKKLIASKIEKFNLERQSEVNLIARENGIELDQLLVNKRSKAKKSKKVKEHYDGGEFNMVYRKELENKMALKLTLVEKGFYSWICDFVSYPTNCVIINDQVPTIETLTNIIGIKERALRGHLKTLESKGLIKLVQFGHKKAIYINPRYYASGKDLDIETLRMFYLIECDENKINSYI